MNNESQLNSDHSCESLLNKEVKMFEDEYCLHYVEGESKPKNIGKPYFLHNPESIAGVLLVHGLMAAPYELRELADFLYSKGYSVYVIRLAGHGTSPYDLSKRRLNEWVKSVDRGYEILKSCCENVSIGGFSAGAGLALLDAIEKPEAYDAVISISAPLQFKSSAFGFAEVVHFWNTCMNKIGFTMFCKEFVKNKPDNPHINYFKCPVQSVVQLKKLMDNVYKALPNLNVPSIIMQAKNDPLLHKRNTQIICSRISKKKSFYKDIDSYKHGIVNGEISKGVFDEIAKFLNLVYLSKRK